MRKKTLFASVMILAIFSLSFASAFSFSELFESWTYSQDTIGENTGFSLKYKTSIPEVQSNNPNCNFVDHSSDKRNLKRCLSLTDLYNQDTRFSQDSYFDARHRYNADKALDNAFRTFNRDRQLQLQNERARESERNRYRYSNFGYGYYRPYNSYYYW